MGTEELSTSFSTAGVTEETETQSHTGQRWRFKVHFVHSGTVIGRGRKENVSVMTVGQIESLLHISYLSDHQRSKCYWLNVSKAIKDDSMKCENNKEFEFKKWPLLLGPRNPAGYLRWWSERLFSVSKLSAWRGTGQPFVYLSRAQELRAKWAPKLVTRPDQEGDMWLKITPNLLIPRKRRLPSSMNSSLSG